MRAYVGEAVGGPFEGSGIIHAEPFIRIPVPTNRVLDVRVTAEVERPNPQPIPKPKVAVYEHQTNGSAERWFFTGYEGG